MIQNHFKWAALISMLSMGMLGCTMDSEGEEDEAEVMVMLEVVNQSQFELHDVLIYREDHTYTDATDLLGEGDKLEPNGGSLFKEVPPDSNTYYRVTVTRRKNKDAPLSAYTSSEVMAITEDSVLTYYDDHFKFKTGYYSLSERSFPDYPDGDGEPNASN
jgi:hypothetical protein